MNNRCDQCKHRIASLTIYNICYLLKGLYCLGNNHEVVYEQKLTSAAVEAAEELLAAVDVAVVGYDGDDLYTTDVNRTEVVELHEKFGEPASEKISSLTGHLPGVHKLLLMDNDIEKLNQEVRPRLEELAKEYKCVVTQAVPTMLELLPFGCSKAKGVQMLCEHLGVDPATQLLTLVSLAFFCFFRLVRLFVVLSIIPKYSNPHSIRSTCIVGRR